MSTRLLLTGCLLITIGLSCCLSCWDSSLARSPHEEDEDGEDEEDDVHLILRGGLAVRVGPVVGGLVVEMERQADGRTDSSWAGKCRRKILDWSAVNFHNLPSSMPTAAWWTLSSAGLGERELIVEDILG